MSLRLVAISCETGVPYAALLDEEPWVPEAMHAYLAARAKASRGE